MIELKNDTLVFSFPEVHPDATLTIQFQRTLRIPDDGRSYPLPPGLGAFPLRHVDDHAERVPPQWLEHGGVLLPMYQSEAVWLHFNSTYLRDRDTSYPFAIKVATGKIDAVSGETWSNGLHRGPQDYMVAPQQPWLDGYCVSKGLIRQFVAMRLGEGYTAEEQLTGQAEHGGMQLVVYPMKSESFDRLFPIRPTRQARTYTEDLETMARNFCKLGLDMGLAPGGKMKQEIYEDPFDLEDWHLDQRSRCFVHILNSHWWQAITGAQPPHKPPTAKQYTQAGLPWFDYYDADSLPLEGSPILAGLKSIAEMARDKRQLLPEEAAVVPSQIVQLRAGLRKPQVREGNF